MPTSSPALAALRRPRPHRGRRSMHVRALAAVAFGAAAVSVATTGCNAGPSQPAAGAAWGVTPSAPCDRIDPRACLLPFPNDYFSVADARTVTGRRFFVEPGSLPRSSNGTPMDLSAWEANDGFSPGSTILAEVPGLDIAASHIATLSDIGTSLSPSAPIVLLDSATGKHWPYFAELDSQEPSGTQLLMIHPATELTEGDRYVVALRNLRNASGSVIPANAAFSHLLGSSAGMSAHDAALAAHTQGLVAELASAGVPAHGLDLVWDFTVASTQNLTSYALHMRNQAFAALGDGVPAFHVDSVSDPPATTSPFVAREITGTFDVPSYLDKPGGPPGSMLHFGADGMPAQLPGNVQQAPFACEIPRAADPAPGTPGSPVHAARIGLYGHGLFGSAAEVYESGVPDFSDRYDYVFCGSNWFGLSHDDLGADVGIVSNLSLFPSIPDRMLQALLDFQFLGRLLDNPRGFATSSAFQAAGSHEPLFDPASPLVYDGNSEGGIMGGAFTALSTDVHRAVLGVPGMDYALLLDRSVDYSPFLAMEAKAYPDPVLRQIGSDLIEMLWDRGEAEGYAEQMTTHPLPGTPAHVVILDEAFGDHQVANAATEYEARTIGAELPAPALAPGRSNEAVPFWGLVPIAHFPYRGSALVMWDSGVPPAPLADLPPRVGPDPHGSPRASPLAQRQMAVFYATGTVIDPCAGPCRSPV